MATRSNGYKTWGAMIRWGRSRARAVGLVAVAVGALIAAVAAFSGGTNHAAAQMALGLNAMESCAVTKDFGTDAKANSRSLWSVGSEAMSASWPTILAYSRDPGPDLGWSESPAREVYVWATFMTAGTATDGTSTYTGYMPGAGLGSEGSLHGSSFTYGSTEYTVQGIFHQQVNDGVQQVVFVADKKLPEYLVFYADNTEFKLSESLVMGADENIRAWRVDADPGWSEGQRVLVTLLEEHGGHPQLGATCD